MKALFVSDVVKFTGDFYPETDQHLTVSFIVFFMSSYRWVLDLQIRTKVSVSLKKLRSISFWDDTVVVTIANIIGESWFRIHVH